MLKIECDVCGLLQDKSKAKTLDFLLPAIPDEFGNEAGRNGTLSKQLDACYSCAKKIHKAAERVTPNA